MVSSVFSLVLLSALLGGVAVALPAAPITHKPASDFKFFDIPTPAAGPCDLETGPDGAEWVQYLFAEKLARIDPVTGNITEYAIPFKGPLGTPDILPAANGKALLACVIRAGKDGNLYAANGLRNQLVKLDMKTKKVSVFTPPGLLQPVGNLQPLNDLWGAEEGMYFSQSTSNQISLFDYTTHKIKSWTIPTPLSAPLGMRTAVDGKLWFTELAAQKIASLDHKTGNITEYPLPVPALVGPAVLRVQEERRYLYFTAALSNSIGRIDIFTGEFKAFPNTAPVSAASVPSEDTADSRGNVWFCTWTQNLLHKLHPATGHMVHIEIPHTAVLDPVSLPFAFGIGLDYYNVKGANQIYFTQATLNRVGRYQL